MKPVRNTLLKYKDCLDAGTPTDERKSRYHTMLAALTGVASIGTPDRRIRILELGTVRSFVDGAFEGCNTSDSKYWDPADWSRWDWGAGSFSYLCNEFMCANHPNYEFHGVDLARAHIDRARHITVPFRNNVRLYVDDSTRFLTKFKTKADLIYMDTGDMTPIEATADLARREATAIIEHKLLNPGGLILIDDVHHPIALAQQPDNEMGKAKYSIPLLLANGFEPVASEFQWLLRKV